jgi:predicted small lipoprotein YifL
MKRILILIGVVALVASACGSGDVGNAGPVTFPPADQGTTTAAPGPGTTASIPDTDPTVPPTTETPPDRDPDGPTDGQFVEVFFITPDLKARPVIRVVELPSVATNAIRELLAGPRAQDGPPELTTAIPEDTLLLGLTIDDGLATIDLSREFESGGGTTSILSRLAQVVYTLTQFPTVDQVRFHLDGRPVDVFSGEGVILEDPVDRSDYATILPIEPGPGAGEPVVWTQTSLPSISEVESERLRRVTLVSGDDVLNVRLDPDVQAPIVGMLPPGTAVILAGQEAVDESTVWVTIETPLGAFWVSSWFLTPVVDPGDFAADAGVTRLLDAFAAIMRDRGDLRQVTGRRGLYVAHHDDPVWFGRDELATTLVDDTSYQWGSAAADPDEIPARTFAEAVAESFVAAYGDTDTVMTINRPIAGGNGRLREAAIPVEFQSFNYVGIHDPGDNPEYDGLDWVTWYVSIDYEDGTPVVVGLTIDAWSP